MANKNPNKLGLKPFKKGESGNKNGRPKDPGLVKLIAHAQKTLKAIDQKIESDPHLTGSDPKEVKKRASGLSDRVAKLTPIQAEALSASYTNHLEANGRA